jgi:hypothetical protein
VGTAENNGFAAGWPTRVLSRNRLNYGTLDKNLKIKHLKQQQSRKIWHFSAEKLSKIYKLNLKV